MESKEPRLPTLSVAAELKKAMEERRKALGFATLSDYRRHLYRQDAIKNGGFPFAVNLDDKP
ncbi:hypothetical protein [Rufibacter roseus]|uniref:Uncharacterized protein n=1 Tax=Rufibacter roseus TaxID=1567108 RepID=A0ABW2DNZ1_9BACT|nr:hypothetical protein [Rufibacter roseus]